MFKNGLGLGSSSDTPNPTLTKEGKALTHLLSGRCRTLHRMPTNRIFSYCFTSFPRTSSQKECFNNHILNNIIRCPTTCKRKCRTFEEWIHNHKDEDPNFSNISLTKQQDRARLQQCIRDGGTHHFLSDIHVDTTTTQDYYLDTQQHYN